MLYYLMGKSGSGKDTIYRELLLSKDPELYPLIIYTTRPVRSGEREGAEYHFTDERHLQELLDAGKVIELRRYDTVHGIWSYFTVDDGQVCPGKDYLGIGTLESYQKLRVFYGAESVEPIYLEVEDGLRLSRALERERMQETPKYEEMCRRFLADQKDFSPEKLEKAGIRKIFSNNGGIAETLGEIREYIKNVSGGRKE